MEHLPEALAALTTHNHRLATRWAYYQGTQPRGGVTDAVRDLFREWLTANYPDRANHVFKLIRDMRGGKDYDSEWGKRMKGTGPYAWMIGRRFEMTCEKLGLNAARLSLSVEHFRAPKADDAQMSLF